MNGLIISVPHVFNTAVYDDVKHVYINTGIYTITWRTQGSEHNELHPLFV